MPGISPSLPLRTLLAVDALTCGLMGVLLTAAAGPIAALTAIPSPLLLTAGLALLPVAAFMGLVARRPGATPAAVRVIVAGNVLWVAASLGVMIGIDANGIGQAFLGLQALTVALLTYLERAALRRAHGAGAVTA